MARARLTSLDTVSNVIRHALSRGATVEIDGLGSFRKKGKGYAFTPNSRPRVFIAYAHEDAVSANRLFDALLAAGFEPWMDERKLLPGQNWTRAIQNALETSDFAVCCFSRASIHKRGGFQSEIRFALACARRLPLDETFLLPARLEECAVPQEVACDMQYVDLFPDWNVGMKRLIDAIRQQMRRPKAA
jgi:hypothetical protein